MAKEDCYIPPPKVTMNFTDCDETDGSLCKSGTSKFIEQFIEKYLNQTKVYFFLRKYMYLNANTNVTTVCNKEY
jgi:hypothetical protein